MNATLKPTARVTRLQDGKLQLVFDSWADFSVAKEANDCSHKLPVAAEQTGLDGASMTFDDSVNMETLVRHFYLQLNLVDA